MVKSANVTGAIYLSVLSGPWARAMCYWLRSWLLGGSSSGLGPGLRENGQGLPVPSPSHQVLPSWQREVDRNQELLTRIRQLQERETEAEAKMKEQLERTRLCQQSLDAAGKKLREKEDSLAQAGEVRACLRDATAPRCPPFVTLLPTCAPTFLDVAVIVAEIAELVIFHLWFLAKNFVSLCNYDF